MSLISRAGKRLLDAAREMRAIASGQEKPLHLAPPENQEES